MKSKSLTWRDIKDKVIADKNISFVITYGEDKLGFISQRYDYFRCPRCEKIIEPVEFNLFQKNKCDNCDLNIYPFYSYYSDNSKANNVISSLVWDDNVFETNDLISLIKKYLKFLILKFDAFDRKVL